MDTDDIDNSVRTRRRFVSDGTTVSGLTTCDGSSNRRVMKESAGRNATISQKSLHPSNGKLKCRLSTSVQHIPEKPITRKPRCQLHRWARDRGGGEVMAGVIRCTICQVDLCIDCFQLFHKEGNLVSKKNQIAASKE